MSHHPETYFLNIDNQPFNKNKTSGFSLYLIEPKEDCYFCSLIDQDGSHLFKSYFLNPHLLSQIKKIYGDSSIKVKAKILDLNHYETKFGLENNSTLLFELFDMYALIKKSSLKQLNIQFDNNDDEERLFEYIQNGILQESVDYFYIFDVHLMKKEVEIDVYHFSTQIENYYEDTRTHFYYSDLEDVLPPETKIDPYSFAHLLISQSEAECFMHKKPDTIIYQDPRITEAWKFIEGQHLIFFNAP